MKIRLAEYKEGIAVPVHEDYNPKDLDLEVVDRKYPTKLTLDGTVEKGKDTLTFRGRLTSPVEHVCGRCLKTMPGSIDLPFVFYYETEGKETIETIDDLREVLILDHPLNFLCSESCRGLCPQCGTNLNEARCSCAAPAQQAGPFAQLKKLWNKKENN